MPRIPTGPRRRRRRRPQVRGLCPRTVCAGNRARRGSSSDFEVYHRSVPAQLEDTLVTGYVRLARESPRRRIDLELRALDLLFGTLFGLLLLPVAAAIAIVALVSSGRPV